MQIFGLYFITEFKDYCLQLRNKVIFKRLPIFCIMFSQRPLSLVPYCL